MKLSLILSVFCFLLSANGLAQIETQADTSKATKITINYSDLAEGFREDGNEVRILSGNVELRQDSVFLSCDTAILNIVNNDVTAYGNVVIQQGDSLNVFADSIYFSGNDKKAKLYNEVVLINNDQKIFTDQLNYDLEKKVATYYSGAILTDGETQLQSKKGYYYIESDQAFFKDSVTVISPEFELRADTLEFNTATRIVTFNGPTRIDQDEAKIYCEEGFYDITNKKAEFQKNAQYLKKEQAAEADLMSYDGATKKINLIGNATFKDGLQNAAADQIIFDEKTDLTTLIGNAKFEDDSQQIDAEKIVYNGAEKTFSTEGRSSLINPPQFLLADKVDFDESSGLGIASGNVIWQDTVENTSINCDVVEYVKETDYLKAYGKNTLFKSLIEDDTLFLRSDTLISVRSDSFALDSARLFYAFEDVRILKTDFQAVCDSLVYNGQDSLFQFFKNPIVWSDTSQFTADTISMILRNNTLDTIILKKNSFIINSPDDIYYNQIKGRDIFAFFTNNELDNLDVLGNAESVYYLLDDAKAYIAVNKTICSDMELDFGNNTVKKIKCYPEPKAQLIPMKKANHKELQIKGFNWEVSKRPLTLKDLFKIH